MKSSAHWQKIGQHAHHGILIPLASLRSEKSCGIGEFYDLLKAIDFCKEVGFDVIQLLPMNDTGSDASPYNALSSCALDPVYLSLSELPFLGSLEAELADFRLLNLSARVAIHEVKQKKLAFLYRYFTQIFPMVSQQKAYQDFVAAHDSWLNFYATFKSLKAKYQGAHWKHWPKTEGETPDTKFHYFLQFLCFDQMGKVKEYANEKNCFLKGDIPILISSDSADVWAFQSLFLPYFVAGSPPDYYNAEGQKWGFPLYNWQEMRETHFAWWKRRLSVAERLYHIYRVDHVVGFFRIWAIPEDKGAKEGHFIPEDASLWAGLGKELLEMMLDSCSLLPIAEDLGTIPPEVPRILKELGICGTKVIRWEKKWHFGGGLIPLNEYEPFSLTTISTPDSDTLQMWWEKYPEEAKTVAALKAWEYTPHLSQEQRWALLYDAHHSSSYFHVNLLQEYLALFPDLVSANSEEERINIPGTCLPTNWTYRFRPSIEQMLSHEAFIASMRKLLHIK